MKVLRAGGFGHQRGGLAYQRGGFAMGLIVGLLIGLALALAVALYVTKAPVPFMNKVPQRTAEQDAAEVEKNRNWDPNSPLYGKNPAKTASGVVTQAPAGAGVADSAASSASAATAAASTPRQIAAAARAASAAAAASAANADAATATAKGKPKRDPNDILNDRPVPADSATSTTTATTTSTTPSASTSSGPQTLSTRPGVDPFLYFIQAGAYARQEDADQQRARLAIQGFSPKVTEREQSGRTVYRVRVGPYDKKEDADGAKEKLESAGVEAALVRVQK